MSEELAKYVNKSRLLIVNMYNIFKDRTKILDNYKKGDYIESRVLQFRAPGWLS